ncbi:MAG: ABC transporter ATP-binding protein [Candidatus Bathyarchaeia archaeon]
MILEIKNLKTYYATPLGPVRAVDGVNIGMNKGKSLGIAGESGCGKSTLALSILKMLPSDGRIVEGEIRFMGRDVVKLPEDEMRKIRWKRISLIFQGAMNAFHPFFKIKDQLVEAIMTHERNISKNEALERTAKLLEMVGLEKSKMESFPHELSGGMRQRALIAMAVSCNPDLLIADEPQTALDVITKAQVLKLIDELRTKMDMSLILITHDLSAISSTCDEVTIMYAGKIVEYGKVTEVFIRPAHPYTQVLINAFPEIKTQKPITFLEGYPPNLLSPPSGCRFHPRCKYLMEICKREEPNTVKLDGEHYVSCHLYS